MYTVTLNSDRVHICLNNVPVETIMFAQFSGDGDDGKHGAVGYAVCKALEFKEDTQSNIPVQIM